MNWRKLFKRKSLSNEHILGEVKMSSNISSNAANYLGGYTNNYTGGYSDSNVAEFEATKKLISLRSALTNYMKNLEKSKEKTPKSRVEFDLCQTLLRKIDKKS